MANDQQNQEQQNQEQQNQDQQNQDRQTQDRQASAQPPQHQPDLHPDVDGLADKKPDELTPEELRLMADTMPGEGPGD